MPHIGHLNLWDRCWRNKLPKFLTLETSRAYVQRPQGHIRTQICPSHGACPCPAPSALPSVTKTAACPISARTHSLAKVGCRAQSTQGMPLDHLALWPEALAFLAPGTVTIERTILGRLPLPWQCTHIS